MAEVGQGLRGSDLEQTEDWAAGGQGHIPGRCMKVQAESEGARAGWAGSPGSQVGAMLTSCLLWRGLAVDKCVALPPEGCLEMPSLGRPCQPPSCF